MEILNISKCRKPHHSGTFKGSKDLEGKVRYKHFEQLSDDVLGVRSILKAHSEVEKSAKMRAYKAIPALTTALIGTSLAIAQPGKLSKKMSAGLGFLMLSKGISLIGSAIEKVAQQKDLNSANEEISNKKSTPKKTLKILGAAVLAAGAAVGAVKGRESLKKHISKEAVQLSSEINSTKLGKFVDKKVTPFFAKHKKLALSFDFIIPMGIIGGSYFAQIKLANSLSKDIKEKSEFNFKKGKEIQRIAREHFDTIDATEV